MTKSEAIIKALLARGCYEVPGKSRKYRTLERPANPTTGISPGNYYVGRNGTLRAGETSSHSISLTGPRADVIAAEGRALANREERAAQTNLADFPRPMGVPAVCNCPADPGNPHRPAIGCPNHPGYLPGPAESSGLAGTMAGMIAADILADLTLAGTRDL